MTRREPWRPARPDAVKVDRSTRFGNPFGRDPGPPGETPAARRARVVAAFRAMLDDPAERDRRGYPSDDEICRMLRGRELACWCPLDGPCHADALLERANAETGRQETRERMRP